LHLDLLEQARHLATRDRRGKPKQTNLRRAVSSAYYGLFHYLTRRSSLAVIGAAPEERPFRNLVARGFVHGTMLAACKSFANTTMPHFVQQAIPTLGIPAEIRQIADTFSDAQETRHAADYDLSKRFRRSDVLTFIGQVEAAIQAFENLPRSSERHFFLVALLIWKQLSQR
jgi:hypothetical protein